MRTSRISAVVVAALGLFAADHARAQEAGGTTVVLNTYSSLIVNGNMGPNRLGDKTGAGTMDASFAYSKPAYATNPNEVLIGVAFTRSAARANGNNSYMQGGIQLLKLTASGVQPQGAMLEEPTLKGDRPYMRPLIEFTDKYVVTIAASEDNNSNNGNPKPVLFLRDLAGARVAIKGNTRGNNINLPTDLVQEGLQAGLNIPNPNNQRGPHSIAAVPGTNNSFVVGMQYNNQAQEAFRFTVTADGDIQMNWFQRFSNDAQHCRPQVAISPTGEGYIAAIEADTQPSDIGARLTKFNIDTGKPIVSKIVLESKKAQRIHIAEPMISIVGDKVALEYGVTAARGQKTNGHGNVGAQRADVALFNKDTLAMVGEPLLAASQFGRHAHAFATTYGPNAEPALAVISGSSDGQGRGFEQIIPLKVDGTIGLKDPAKMYVVAPFADVANVQARGKNNPNDQAKGFINGVGNVPNPGFDKGTTAFMPEVKTFNLSAVTGYGSAEDAKVGLKNGVWFSLVPATWKEGLQTTPGVPTDKPGTDANGMPSTTGSLPRTNAPPTDPSGDATSDPGSVIPEGEATETESSAPGVANGQRPMLGSDNGGCNVARTSGGSSAAVVALAIAGVVLALRRKREEA